MIWLIVAFIALIFEFLVPGLYFIWFALGAVISAIVFFFYRVSLETEVITFAVLTLSTIVCYQLCKRFAKEELGLKKDNLDAPDISAIRENVIGRTAVMVSSHRASFADSYWEVESFSRRTLNEGDVAKIIDLEKNTLIVE